MSVRDTPLTGRDDDAQTLRARESDRGFEIFVPAEDAAWLASNLTVPLDAVR